MQRKDLEEQLESLKKATQEGQPPSNAIVILRRLQLEVVPSEELLRVRSLFSVRSVVCLGDKGLVGILCII